MASLENKPLGRLDTFDFRINRFRMANSSRLTVTSMENENTQQTYGHFYWASHQSQSIESKEIDSQIASDEVSERLIQALLQR